MARHGRMSVTLARIGVWIWAVGAVVVAASIGGYRLETLPLTPAFIGYVASVAIMALATLFLLVGMIGGRGRMGSWAFNGVCWIALVLCVGMTLNNLLWLRQGQVSPPIHDITTDTVNPPQFVDILPLRAGSPNPPEYAGSEVAEQQLAAYPEIVPLELDVTPAEAMALAESAARAMEWELVTVASGEGRLEAVATTAWFGFKDDIVVRIVETGDGSLVDVRSKSRLGLSDVGTNARRIRRFMAQMQPG
ncbi:MAG: DUF1499 domain-containing protein [Gammaproteobacteria bacterium]|nr:DUF1499 domain-containing protein [Gammaproteobacteria bacterium]MDE0414646.1 DUF1499 domain-containing protein [Gammaproteobacteria bacterium]